MLISCIMQNYNLDSGLLLPGVIPCKPEAAKSSIFSGIKYSLTTLAATVTSSTILKTFIKNPDIANASSAHLAYTWAVNTVFHILDGRVLQSGSTLHRMTGKITCLLHNFQFTTAIRRSTGTFLHELGHYLAANMLFSNPQTTIEMYDIGKGACLLDFEGLSAIGKLVGENGADFILAAGGFSMDMLLNVAATIGGHYAEKKSGVFNLLNTYALTSIYSCCKYALACVDRPEGDYYKISEPIGLTPYHYAALLIGVPLLTKAILHASDSWKAKPSQEIS